MERNFHLLAQSWRSHSFESYSFPACSSFVFGSGGLRLSGRIMSDSMAICLGEVLNDSCFPRTLGTSEVEPPETSFLPDVTFSGAILLLALMIGIPILICRLCIRLKVWFEVYKLQYLLRMHLLLFSATTVLHQLIGDGTWIHDDCNYYVAVVWAYSAIGSLNMLCVRYHWKKPLDITKTYHDVRPSEYMRETFVARNRVRRFSAMSDLEQFPPCYPNYWIPICESRTLEPGQKIGVSALGMRFCVFKGEESGEVFVLDAYCPHLGADLTVGGVVRGDCIECPFHGWHADGRDGTCTRGTGHDSDPPVPNGIRTRTWPACEVNGWVYIWHHAEPHHQQQPSWDMPRVEKICDGSWVYRGRTEHEVRCHIQEIPENGADINHLSQLHSASVLLGNKWMETKSWLNIVNHNWEPEWRRDETQSHIARIRLSQTTRILGFDIPGTRLDIDIEQIGPATVHLYINSPLGKGILTQHIIPEGPLTMKVIHQLYTEPAVKPVFADLLIRAEAIMLERDIVVWNHKKFLKRPKLLKDEKNIRKYRTWYEQFYSTNSPKLANLNSAYMKQLDW